MQMHHNKPFVSQEESWAEESTSSPIDIDRLLGAARRQWRLIAWSGVAGLVLGVIYITTATPLYTAYTRVLIDKGNNALLTQLSTIDAVADDEGTVLSQVELLKSETIASAVVDRNKLLEDPVFMANNASLLRSARLFVAKIVNVRNWFSESDDAVVSSDEARQEAIAKLISDMDVSRVGRTYVLEIAYTSPSPELSARIANAVGDAYLTDKLDSKFEATRMASSWLQDRIAELRQRALETDLAVQKFRAANGLVAAGDQLATDQRLAENNSALIAAQAETAKARALYERIMSVIESGDAEATVTEAISNPVISSLRTKYLDAAKRQSDIARLLGKDHIQAVRLQREMDDYKKQMFEELGRLAEASKSELEVAQANERNVRANLDRSTEDSATANETQVQLRELERESETYRNLYQSFLERYQQAVQQQTFPITDSRVISRAAIPDKASAPKKPMALALFMLLGLGAGTMAGAFREYRDRFFRTGEQLREELGMELLGIAPLVEADHRAVTKVDPASQSELVIRKTTSVANYVIDHSLSAFAEALRGAKIAVDLAFPSKPCRVIGVISALPDEGKSTVSVNFAELLAKQGARTLLIDADLRNPGATRMLATHAKAGLLEVLLEKRPVETVLMHNPATNLAFLPAIIKQRVPHSSEILNSGEMRRLLELVKGKFDYVILDLPPLAPVVDARAMEPQLDGFLFVIEWGKTARRTIRHTLLTEPRITDKCVGVVLNKVDMEKMKLYRTFGSVDHYYSRYSRYYHEN